MTDSVTATFTKDQIDDLTKFLSSFLRDDFVFSTFVPGTMGPDGYHSVGYNHYTPEARDFIQTARDTGFINPKFLDTSIVSEQRSLELRSNPEFLERASAIEIANYITFLSRMERFNDSAFSAAFQEGFIISLLNRLKHIANT